MKTKHYNYLFSLVVVVHVLNDKVGSTEVNETSARVHVLEERSKQLHEFVFSVVVKNKVLLIFDKLVPFLECLFSELGYHLLFE